MFRKWKGIQDQLPDEISRTGYCAVHPSACTRASATFLEIIREGRRFDGMTRIATINRAINQAIAPKTDMELYGVEEFWATPLQTFAMGAGDCEDYAIAKFAALSMAGVPAADLRLLVVRDNAVNDYHAVAAFFTTVTGTFSTTAPWRYVPTPRSRNSIRCSRWTRMACGGWNLPQPVSDSRPNW